MKKYILILILSLPVTLLAQDNIIIPKGQDTLYRMLITPWYGIDPIQTKDGNFILPVKVIKDIEAFGVKFPIVTKEMYVFDEELEKEDSMISVTVTPRFLTVTTELKKLPVKDIKDIELKVEAVEIVTPKVIIK